MSRKHKRACTTLNCIEHFIILVSVITGSIPISALAFLFGVPVAIASVAIGLEILQLLQGLKSI